MFGTKSKFDKINDQVHGLRDSLRILEKQIYTPEVIMLKSRIDHLESVVNTLITQAQYNGPIVERMNRLENIFLATTKGEK